MISLGLVFVFMSCEKKTDETILKIDYQKIVINKIGEFSYNDSLIYVGIDTIKYQIKIVSSDSTADLYYSTGQRNFMQLDSEWITVDSTVEMLSFYSTKKGYLSSDIQKLSFNFKNDSLLKKLAIYPNPTDGLIKVEFNDNSRGELFYDIFDMSGKKIRSFHEYVLSNSFLITNDLTDIPSGLYIAKFYFGKNSKTMKIIKQ